MLILERLNNNMLIDGEFVKVTRLNQKLEITG